MQATSEAALQDDEKILWEGRPQRRFVLFWLDLVGIPFSLFTAFLIGYNVLVVLPQIFSDHPIFVFFRIALGLGALFGTYPAVKRLIISPLRLATKWYVVTDRRVIISDQFKTVEFSPDQLHAAKCITALVPRSGHVQIDFTSHSGSGSSFTSAPRDRKVFLAIDEPEAACVAIQRLIASVDGAGT